MNSMLKKCLSETPKLDHMASMVQFSSLLSDHCVLREMAVKLGL